MGGFESLDFYPFRFALLPSDLQPSSWLTARGMHCSNLPKGQYAVSRWLKMGW